MDPDQTITITCEHLTVFTDDANETAPVEPEVVVVPRISAPETIPPNRANPQPSHVDHPRE